MSAEQPTYEATVQLLTQVQGEVKTLREAAAKIAEDKPDDKDKEQEASYKKAMKDMKDHTKEATEDMDKVKEAFKIANEETDPEKKKEAMKKAIDEKDDYMNKKSTHGKDHKGMTDEEKEKEAKTAARLVTLEDKSKTPIIAEMLQATKIINPTNYDKLEKELTAATLEQVEEKYEALRPYIAAVMGFGQKQSPPTMPGMGIIPFQASTITGDIPSTDSPYEGNIDWSTVDTNKIKKDMYQ